MNQKVLWKIESLWEQHYKPVSGKTIDIQNVYENGISKYNSNFHVVKNFDFKASKDVVHTDAYGEYKGLEKSQVLFSDGKPIYLFDNHNKIIQPFLEYTEIIRQGFDVVHIDAHDDDAIFPQEKPHHLELKHVKEYIKKTRISDFFDFLSGVSLRGTKQSPVSISNIANTSVTLANAGIQVTPSTPKKLINNIHHYTKSSDFEQFKKPANPYIFSLDIDIFGPEGYFIDLESKVRIIAQAWSEADMVSLATSPGFIDQEFAREIVEVFVKEKTTHEFLLINSK